MSDQDPFLVSSDQFPDEEPEHTEWADVEAARLASRVADPSPGVVGVGGARPLSYADQISIEWMRTSDLLGRIGARVAERGVEWNRQAHTWARAQLSSLLRPPSEHRQPVAPHAAGRTAPEHEGPVL